MSGVDIGQRQSESEQVKLLEKFKQLRQWQQRHQQNLISQHQQQLEQVKAEQEHVNAILATERRLHPMSNSRVDEDAHEMDMEYSKTIVNENPRFMIGGSDGINFYAQPNQLLQTMSMQPANALRTVKRKLMSPPKERLPPQLHDLVNKDFRQTQGLALNGNNPLQDVTNHMQFINTEKQGVHPALEKTKTQQMMHGEFSNNPFYLGSTLAPGVLQPLINDSSYQDDGDDFDSDDDDDDEVVGGLSRISESPEECDTISGIYPLKLDDDNKSEINDSRDKDDFNDSNNLSEEEEEEEEHEYEEHQESMENEEDFDATITDKEEAEAEQAKNIEDSPVCHEEKPIQSGIGKGARTFEELLELKLRQEEEKLAEEKKAAPAVKKQPFLKRGEGLSRFGMKTINNLKNTKTQKPADLQTKPNTTMKLKTTSNKQDDEQRKEVKKVQSRGNMKDSATNKQQAQRTGERKVSKETAPENKGKVQKKSVSDLKDTERLQDMKTQMRKLPGFSTEAVKPQIEDDFASRVVEGPFTLISNTTKQPQQQGVPVRSRGTESQSMMLLEESFQKKLEEWENKAQEEEEELEEFLLLEQAAANSSISSNSSLMMKVFKRKRQDSSTSCNTIEEGFQSGGLDTGYSSEDVKTTTASSTSPSPPSTYRDQERGTSTGDLNQDNEDDASSTSSSSLDNDSDEDDAETTIRSNINEHDVSSPHHSTLCEQVNFDDDETWGEINQKDLDSDEDSVVITTVRPLVTSTPPVARLKMVDAQAMEKASVTPPPTSSLVSKLFPQLKKNNAKGKPEVLPVAVPVVAESKQEASPPPPPSQNPDVKNKLQELELEIEKFRAENAALSKLKAEKEKGLLRLKEEIESFEKQKAEELQRLEKFRDEETKKLRHEKKVFEKYQKAARAGPDKKEREEIENLKNQLTELQEEMKRRESRWTAASSRLKNRIETLEKENKELKDEVMIFERDRIQRLQTQENKVQEEDKPIKVSQRKVKQLEPTESTSSTLFAQKTEKIPAMRNTFQKPEPHSKSSHTKQTLQDVPCPMAEPSQGDSSVLSVPFFNVNDVSSHIAKEIESCPLPRNVHFGDGVGGYPVSNLQPNPQEIRHPDGKVETVDKDGRRVIVHSNGTRKEISADGQSIAVKFFNGDIKQILADQRVVYYYADAQTTHSTYPDGLEVLQFPNKQIEKHYPDGTKEIIFPDQTIKYLRPDGREEVIFSDGTIQRLNKDGEMTIEFPNGQREIHTKNFKKREYPDGTVKTVYPDGRQETHYSNGRVRIKDKDGRLVIDTGDKAR